MKKYTVNFYYRTDLRCHWTGEALNEITALMLAMNHHRITEWVTSDAFRIEIKSL